MGRDEDTDEEGQDDEDTDEEGQEDWRIGGLEDCKMTKTIHKR